MHERYALPTATLERLADYLNSEANEHGLDFFGTHGFLCAITVGPQRPTEQWLDDLFEGNIPNEWVNDLQNWQKSLHALLYHEQDLIPPCSLVFSAQGNELTDWCVGFMEGVFSDEEAWYSHDEDSVVELTLPIVAISELIDDPELAKMRRQPKLIQQLAKQIPSVLTELYLLFHAPRL